MAKYKCCRHFLYKMIEEGEYDLTNLAVFRTFKFCAIFFIQVQRKNLFFSFTFLLAII